MCVNIIYMYIYITLYICFFPLQSCLCCVGAMVICVRLEYGPEKGENPFFLVFTVLVLTGVIVVNNYPNTMIPNINESLNSGS